MHLRPPYKEIWPLSSFRGTCFLNISVTEAYILIRDILFVCLFVFVALRPMSTAMVIAGRSVHLTTLFPGQA